MDGIILTIAHIGITTISQPKKTLDTRFLTNFRQVNKRIERKPFPLPRIMEALQKIKRFKSATAIDQSITRILPYPIERKSEENLYNHTTIIWKVLL